MCTTCGCSDRASARITDMNGPGTREPAHDHGHGHEHDHAHSHGHEHGSDHGHPHHHEHGLDHGHPHDPAHDHEHDHDRPQVHRREAREDGSLLLDARPTGRTVVLEQDLLAKNDLIAARNRGWLEGRGILALNLTSSPGAGKTTLLERTIRDLGPTFPLSVIEGDQETVRDAERIRATGCRVIQVNTGSGCHLDADMIARSLRVLDPPPRSLVAIENVGNLVCPALFDLGEHGKVVIVSVTEGEDKPLKYPHMFRASEVMVLNKIDLLPHLAFDADACVAAALRVNPGLHVLRLSATTGEGLEGWYGWLRRQMDEIGARA